MSNSEGEISEWNQNWSNRGSNRENTNSNREEAMENYEESVPERHATINDARLAAIFTNLSNQRPTLEDVKGLVRKIKFTRVRTKTPGERMFAHVLPGSKEWIVVMPHGRQTIAHAIFSMYRSKPPNPTPIPARFKVSKTKAGITIGEIVPPRRARPAAPAQRREYVPLPPRLREASKHEEYDPYYEERTKYGIRPKGWTEANEEKHQIHELVAHSRGVIRGLVAKSEKARERWRMAASRYRESENRNREREFDRRRVENKARREEIKKAYRNRRVAPVDTRRIPTRISVSGIFPRTGLGAERAAVVNKEKLAAASARMRERRAEIERARKPIKVIPVRPTRWTEKLFSTPRAKKCESYTVLELSKIMRKYGEQPAGMSKGQLCDRLRNIHQQLKNNDE